MSVGLAPRPANEEQRVAAVVKTGLIDSPNPDLFQVYCDLAKDITGFQSATFSLYDGEMQCAIALTGRDPSEKKVGDKGMRTEHNICSYVLLDPEPLLMPDVSKDPIWKNHPKAGPVGYAGFPVINKDNYALGTLCMVNNDGPKSLSEHQIDLVKKITNSIAHLLDLKTEQKEMTSQNMLEALSKFRKYDDGLGLADLHAFMSISADIKIDGEIAKNLINLGLCDLNADGAISISSSGVDLQREMRLETKAMKRVKLTGEDASTLIDRMMSEI